MPTFCRGILLFSFLISFFFAGDLAGQDFGSEPPKQYTPGGFLDSVSDLYGKRYSLGQIAIDRKLRSEAEGHSMMGMMAPSCSSGYFQMYLEPGCGMDGSDPTSVARLNVLCRVLYDISNLINSPCTSTGQKVNIWVRAGLSGGALGVATPFFYFPPSPTVSGITDNTIWMTVNSGVDAFTNVATPLGVSGGGSSGSIFFHGSIAFNFSGSISWHTNLATPPAPGAVDLYTVALHEMLHAMGFCSVIDYNGNTVFGPLWKYYSRYDTHLQTTAGTRVLTTPTPGCSMYNWGINPAFSPVTSYFSPGGTGVCPSGYQTGGFVDHTVCSHKMEYAGSWPLNMPVYTPECFERGSSLSHFEDECYVPVGFPIGSAGPATNNQYFVMSNAGGTGTYNALTNPGPMKRYPKPEERQVLCDLGYSVNTSYGDAANLNDISYSGGLCPGLGVVGICDGVSPGGIFTYTTSGTTPVNINAASAPLLANDYGVSGGTFKCLEIVSGSGTLSSTFGSLGTPVMFTPTAGTSGVQLLRYIPVSSTGDQGNITYVYVYVVDGNCLPTACDLVCNGSFENVVPASAVGPNLPSALRCWGNCAGSPDLFTRGCTSSNWCFPHYSWVTNPAVHPIDTIGNNHYIAAWGMYNSSAGTFDAESFQGRLSSTLTPGETYRLSFWAKIVEWWPPVPIHVQFAIAPSVLVPTPSYWHALPSSVTLLSDVVVSHPDVVWHHYTADFTYSGPAGCANLVVVPAPWVTPSELGTRYVLFDDISILPTTSTCSFYLPDTTTTCYPMGLDSLVTVPGGTFSWYADSAGYLIISHDPMFDPAAAYNGSIMSGNNGLVAVCYKYTTPLGCVQEVCDEIYINSSGPILGIPFACVGMSTTLSNPGAGGTWSSSNTSVATITAAGVVTGVATGTSVITYQLPTGCYVTKIVTVDVSPSAILPTTPTVCSGSTVMLSNAIPGGTWTSGTTSVATIIGPGNVYGAAPGTANITYTVSSGCFAVKTVTVNPSPSVISPLPVVCLGSTITLTNTVSGGTWSSTNPAVAPVVSATGVLSGSALGTSIVSYTLPSGCCRTVIATVTPLPSPIVAPTPAVVCVGSALSLSAATTGGSWSAGTPTVCTVDPFGVVTGLSTGTCEITYSMSAGCYVTKTITVSPAVPIITPSPTIVCTENTITLADALAGGIWASSSTAVGTINSVSGVLTGIVAGTTSVTYSVSPGCYQTTIATVNPSPLPITGPGALCSGTSMTLADATAGGSWSSSDVSIASITSGGAVTGIVGGTCIITYTVPGGCFATKLITVNQTPFIDGGFTVCKGKTINLVASVPGGTWLSADATIGTVGSSTGVLTGVSGGTVIVSYTSPAGCSTSTIVTVEPAPISGPSVVGIGATITLSNATTGGTWSSGSPTVATVGSASGLVTGVVTGTTTITYTSSSGCKTTVVITVKKLVGITGGELRAASVTIIPNPNKGTFVITGELVGDRAEVVVTDIVGRIVLHSTASVDGGKLNKEISIPDAFPGGQYFVKVQTENENFVLRFTIVR